jgi:hypothetical protein|nr:MAG: hypothetical protein [Bacteriophage sp.]
MKEIIFLDTKLINSLLAQLDQGLILKQIVEENTSQSNHEETSSTMGIAMSGKVNAAVASASSSTSKEEIDKSALVYSNGNRELVETVINDYSLDLLINKISLLFSDINKCADGDFIKEEDYFKAYDFSLLKNAMDVNSLEFLLLEEKEKFEGINKELTRLKKQNPAKSKQRIKELHDLLENSTVYNFERLHKLSSYVESLLSDCTIFKLGKTLSICERENIRIPRSSLSLLNSSKRKATIIGIAASDIDNDINFEKFANDSNQLLAHGASVFINIVTSSFEITKSGDKFVRPIAIYFE